MKREPIFRWPRLGWPAGAVLTVAMAVLLAVAVAAGGAGPAGARATASGRGGVPSVAAAAPAQNVITTLDPATTTSVQATVGSDGLPVIAYLTGPVQADGTPIDPRTLKLAHCSNIGCTSATIRTLATNAGQQAAWHAFGQSQAGIAIGTDGFPLITYYKAGTQDLAVVHCNDVTCATRATRVIVSTGDVGRDSSVTIAPAIYPRPDQPELPTIPAGPVIAYYNATNGTLQVTRCSDPACAGTKTTKTLDTVGSQGALTSIATSVDGTPIIAYRAVTDAGATFQLRTVYCATDILTATTKFCNQPFKSTLASVSAAQTPNFFATSIVIGSDGLPFIGYGDIAHCTDYRCAAATVNDPASPETQVPMAHSVAVDSDHLPMFAGPFPAGPAPARFAHCVTVECPGAVLGEVGKTNWAFPSVTLGADGLPFIAFSEGVTPAAPPFAGLSVAHCANVFCANLFRRR